MIKAVLLDLSGVIYVGNRVLPGALEAVARLRDADLPIRFLTNTTRTAKQGILEKLRGMGLEIADDELFTPAAAARDWLIRHKRAPHLLIHPDLAEDFQGLPDYAEKAVVIGDAGKSFTYDSLNAAFRAFDGAEFLALANNRTFKDQDGQLSLDAGPFVAALEFATRRKATVLGKPSPDFFGAALESMVCAVEDAVMVGDDAEMDVAGALAAGLGYGVLVRTGKYVEGVEVSVDPRPSAVVDDLTAAVRWIEDCRA
ncbi:TIGR01458 family HAD-type hydrolase [Pelagibius sp. Alg239-R121]|uniref:TIGR01458 family HAD-type hydrolase n=1 Tax=Pelagibius sp. Alg239-R121 TaxID=2993448 RepID=UPI0024A67CB4|nr:TIGR01458 family HAD-type hydrolase [Pelagibius sp. Alg239-R121]